MKYSQVRQQWHFTLFESTNNKTMASLDQLFSKLGIDGGRDGDKDEFAEELDATEFSIFKPLANLGYFAWKPPSNSPQYKPLSSIKSEKEVICYIDHEGKPDQLKSVKQLQVPKRFVSPPSTAIRNKFPYSEIDIACIHVAVKVSNTCFFLLSCSIEFIQYMNNLSN